MSAIDHLLQLARLYAAAEGVELSTVSWRALGDTKKLPAIAAGKDIQVRRCDRAIRWFSDNWPAAAEWPAGIDRPSPSPPTSPSDSVEHVEAES